MERAVQVISNQEISNRWSDKKSGLITDLLISDYSALRAANTKKSSTACPTKPELHVADRSSRPRKRDALHKNDVGEVGRTTMSTSTISRSPLTLIVDCDW